MIAAWLGLCTLVWAALLAGQHRWGRGWGLEGGRPEQPVRVCVPARDEEGRIGPCVRAVRASRGVSLELVVADDHSTDRTAEEAREACATVRSVPERPAGWSGKAWACREAAREATEPWLLFLDADVVVAPDAIAAAVARAERDEADLLSVFGTWELRSFWERVAIPAIGWFVRGAVDLARVNRGEGAFANGQLLLVRRAAYERWGGHEAVRDAVLDDVGLAEVAHRDGARIRLLHAPWAFRVRLYRGLSEILSGYAKNFYAGMHRRPALAVLAAAGVTVTTLLPPLATPWLLATRPGLGLWALGITLALVLFRFRLERRDGRSGLVAPLHPLGAAVLVAVVLASMTTREARWKGRVFRDGRAR